MNVEHVVNRMIFSVLTDKKDDMTNTASNADYKIDNISTQTDKQRTITY